ncbi:substrate-binding domain-containing protein [Marinobacter sp. AC-23]|uniref:substrate-binding domain-containing protein n=1 Tax=Marinobacter sp. AC-23 TaxID=1879031 RepID=UPI0008DD2408|nr:substrate-binding domain-containing protein [Marinobacter sp. AC-23]OHY80174.1 hypothetical protein BCA33_14970 [Marinobacter sp. AC-23]
MLYRPALMLIFLLLFTMSRLVQASAATGRTLTAILEQKSQRLGLIELGQPLPLFALSGTLDSSAAKGRQQGLMETVDANRTRLLQLVDAQWDRQLAKDKSLVLLKRYPQVAAIWSASDGMALGAIEAAKLAGRRPGKDVLVGGVDWEPRHLNRSAAVNWRLVWGVILWAAGWRSFCCTIITMDSISQMTNRHRCSATSSSLPVSTTSIQLSKSWT